MRYQTKITDGVVEVTSPRSGTVHAYDVPPGIRSSSYALRCAERARVAECLAAIRISGRKRAWAGRSRRRGA